MELIIAVYMTIGTLLGIERLSRITKEEDISMVYIGIIGIIALWPIYLVYKVIKAIYKNTES